MLLAWILARLCRRRDRGCALGFLFVLIALVPLAHASPPDPLWIAAIYDGADFDEAVVAVVSATGLVGTPLVLAMPPDIRAGAVSPIDATLAAAAPLSTFPIRAPRHVQRTVGSEDQRSGSAADRPPGVTCRCLSQPRPRMAPHHSRLGARVPGDVGTPGPGRARHRGDPGGDPGPLDRPDLASDGRATL
jgi:hypothetical protein